MCTKTQVFKKDTVFRLDFIERVLIVPSRDIVVRILKQKRKKKALWKGKRRERKRSNVAMYEST